MRSSHWARAREAVFPAPGAPTPTCATPVAGVALADLAREWFSPATARLAEPRPAGAALAGR